MRQILRVSGLPVVLAMTGLLTSGFLLGRVSVPPETTLSADTRALDPSERNTIALFQRVAPSVVHVSNVAGNRSFFTLDQQEMEQGSGTGFVWDRNGHIVTNYHVIHGASQVRVTLANQSSYPAAVVGAHPDKDLAVLKISPTAQRPPVAIGTSKGLLVGQTVFAIGNPFGLDQSLSTGVVSALGREIKALTGRPIQDVIQTDAAINMGNSGGPLLDSRGEVIGVNTMILSPSGANAGIGFAIPIDTVRSVATQLIERGRVTRPGLGVRLLPDTVGERLEVEGAIIERVTRNSAASRAGLRGTQQGPQGQIILGDVITSIDNERVDSGDELYKVLDRRSVGQEVEVRYLRDGRERRARVTLQSIDE
jgi:S1-C subfamily serine protease